MRAKIGGEEQTKGRRNPEKDGEEEKDEDR